jgi:hypothetical protein
VNPARRPQSIDVVRVVVAVGVCWVLGDFIARLIVAAL